jgi:hypothetical protein
MLKGGKVGNYPTSTPKNVDGSCAEHPVDIDFVFISISLPSVHTKASMWSCILIVKKIETFLCSFH